MRTITLFMMLTAIVPLVAIGTNLTSIPNVSAQNGNITMEEATNAFIGQDNVTMEEATEAILAQNNITMEEATNALLGNMTSQNMTSQNMTT